MSGRANFHIYPRIYQTATLPLGIRELEADAGPWKSLKIHNYCPLFFLSPISLDTAHSPLYKKLDLSVLL